MNDSVTTAYALPSSSDASSASEYARAYRPELSSSSASERSPAAFRADSAASPTRACPVSLPYCVQVHEAEGMLRSSE